MNPFEGLIRGFQDLVAQVPDLVQPLIVMLAGAVPFVEGEGAAIVGVIGEINPIIAGIAAATGNFICVLLIVFLTSRAREAVLNRRASRVTAGADPGTQSLKPRPRNPTRRGAQGSRSGWCGSACLVPVFSVP